MKAKFYKCIQCGKIVEVYNPCEQDKLCEDKMEELIPNSYDGVGEKHVPVVSVDKNVVKVKVGEITHPMLDEHYIHWIYIETENGCQRKLLKPGEEPEAIFYLGDEKVITVYEYCNLHGLWKTDVK